MLVYIDPGHGGIDPGAAGGGQAEKDLALEISKKLAEQLTANGVKAKLTRTEDVSTTLASRCGAANGARADVFVSIHLNSNSGTPATGIETLVYSTGSKAYSLAQTVQTAIVQTTGATDRGVKLRPGLYVLKATNMPAILVETGFINNDADRARLCDPAYQTALAAAIAKGVCDWAGVAFSVNESPAKNEPIPGYGSDPAAFIYAVSAASSEMDKVKAMQIALTLDGSPVDVDGIIGKKTEAACKAHVLKNGSRGHCVVFVQRLLCPDAVDAAYGAKTAATVRAWQKAEGKAADGVVGVQTYRGLCLDRE